MSENNQQPTLYRVRETALKFGLAAYIAIGVIVLVAEWYLLGLPPLLGGFVLLLANQIFIQRVKPKPLPPQHPVAPPPPSGYQHQPPPYQPIHVVPDQERDKKSA